MKNLITEKQLEAFDKLAEEGLSFFFDSVRTNVKTLKKKLGPPCFEENDGQEKCNYTWNVVTDTGIPFSIYDWKENRPLDENEYIDFHIGATNEKDSKIAKEALIHFLSYGKDEHPGA